MVIGTIIVAIVLAFLVPSATARAAAVIPIMKRLLTIALILLCFWATEGKLHSFDSQTTTTVAVALLFLPGIGVMDWKKANALIPWGTVVLFGVGIGIGTALLQTHAAQWLAGLIVQWFGLDQLAGLGILAVMAIFLVVIHLGFASATALASTMIPIVIAIMQKVQTPGISVIGITCSDTAGCAGFRLRCA